MICSKGNSSKWQSQHLRLWILEKYEKQTKQCPPSVSVFVEYSTHPPTLGKMRGRKNIPVGVGRMSVQTLPHVSNNTTWPI